MHEEEELFAGLDDIFQEWESSLDEQCDHLIPPEEEPFGRRIQMPPAPAISEEDVFESLLASLDPLDENDPYDTPERFHEKVMTPFLHEKMTELKTKKNLTDEQLSDLSFLYQHYPFFKQNITHLLRVKQQDAFCTDVTRWIIRGYAYYVIHNELPTSQRVQSQNHELPTFGTPQQWMDLCDSLRELYDGNPENYIQQMIALTS